MFIFLDTETTGTGPEDRLCQIAFKPEGGPAVSDRTFPEEWREQRRFFGVEDNCA
jgi:hypothetical protein